LCGVFLVLGEGPKRGHIEPALRRGTRKACTERRIVIQDQKGAIFECCYPWVRLNRLFHPHFSRRSCRWTAI